MACRRTGGCFAVFAGHRQTGSEPCAGAARNVVCGVAVLAQEGCRAVRTAAAVADDVEVLAGCGQFFQTLSDGAEGDVLGAGGVAALPLVVFTHVDDGCACGNVAGVNLGYSSHGVLL